MSDKVKKDAVYLQDLVEWLANKFNLDEKFALLLIQNMFGYLADQLVDGKRVVIKDFATIVLRPSKRFKAVGARLAISAKTGLKRRIKEIYGRDGEEPAEPPKEL